MRAGLKKRRKQLNLTQQQVADMVGIHRATYTNHNLNRECQKRQSKEGLKSWLK